MALRTLLFLAARLLLTLGWFAAGCAAWPPLVPERPQPKPILGTAVATPPPDVRIETMTEPPKDDACRFLGGQWLYNRGQWQWTPGQWVHVPEQCSYAPPDLRWLPGPSGPTLYHRPGAWYLEDRDIPCAPPLGCAEVRPRP